jgi:hypothetical protein
LSIEAYVRPGIFLPGRASITGDGALPKRIIFTGAIMLFGLLGAARADTEEPAFKVVDKVSSVDIRQYGPRIAADVVVAGTEEDARSAGFRLLADYIFGNNSASRSISMTAPVAQLKADSEKIPMTAPLALTPAGGGQWTVRFFMPSSYALATLPRPRNAQVKIVELPGELVAVLRFSNSRNADAVAAKTAELQTVLGGTGWKVAGQPFSWFYDPPWTFPFYRRNEVGVAVVRK